MKKKHSSIELWFDRLLSKSLVRQFSVLGILLFCLFLISWLFLSISGCEWKQFAEKSDIPEWLLPLYLLIDTNAFNNLYINGINGWALVISSLTFVIGAFIFNGAIIGIITNFIERRVTNHNKGKLHYLKSGHHLIMGYDKIVPSIIANVFKKDEEAYVLLLSSEDSELIRERLRKMFDERQMKKIIVNYGYRTSENYYKDICLESAEQVFIVGDRTRPAHDAMNVECVDSICNYLKQLGGLQKPKRITCLFEALDTYAAFKTSSVFSDVKKLDIEFVPYNFYAGWAKQVFVKRKYRNSATPDAKSYEYPCVFGKGIKPNDDKYVHLVFVGTTNFAVAFAMEAAHVLHFPNAAKRKTRITFIDKNADQEKEEFITRNRHFFEVQSYWYADLTKKKQAGEESEGKEPPLIDSEQKDEYVIFTGDDRDFLDVEFEFIKGNIFSKPVQNLICKWAGEHKEEKQYLSIFLAQSNQRENFVMGMNMPDEVYDNAVNVFIRQDRSDNFITNLRTADREEQLTYSKINGNASLDTLKRYARYAHIYPFGMNETGYSEDDHSLKRAKLINYLYATANYKTYKFQSILVLDAMSDDAIWQEADEAWKKIKEPTVALKWSNLYSAYAIRTKLRTLRAMRKLDIEDTSLDYVPLTDAEVEEMAKVEHNRWNVERLLMGCRKARREEDKHYNPGLEKNLEGNKKLFIHHDIRPFDDKLGDIRELDREFSRYIPWIMKMTEGK